jgi:glutamate-ammonia-ligase adenylyltransferase
LNDILGNFNLKETTELLSILAKGINSELFSLCNSEIELKYGLKIKNIRYCLAALGKLGGDELNYSSDIDLILFFDKNTLVKRNPRLEYFEVLNEAAYLFIQTSTAITDKGYIYRIDFRLRPDGRNSPLCRTLRDYLQYYETRGEDWERQMLIKLSIVGGNKKLFESFYNYIQHFIYPASFSTSPLIQIARIKNDIEKKIGEKDNVKLFSGGIRDIEFSIQALQLLNGGRIKVLKTGNSLNAIRELKNHNLINEEESIILSSSYSFYRQVEHFLQLMNDRQTHLIPDDEETLNKLARYMGFKTKKSFQKKVEDTRKQVRDIFNSIIGKEEISISALENIQFIDKKKSLGNYKYLQSGQGLLEQKQFDKQTINAFQKIEYLLLDYLSKSISPDTILENFSRIIKSRGLPSIWYNEFTDDNFFKSFLKICELNKKAVELLVLDKTLGDFLLSRRVLIENFESIENLSINQIIFILSVQYSLGILDHEKFSKYLTKFLVMKIRSISSSFSLPNESFIIGLGSFGTEETTFSSDIDLVFVVDDLIHKPEAQEEFQKLFLKLKEHLKPFDVDSRLRPEGKSSQLVWDLETYKDYLGKRLQTWELQSLTRIKIVYGNETLFKDFLSSIKKRIAELEKKKLIIDVLEMRSRIEKQLLSAPQAQFKNFFNTKKGRGGLIDIEFIFQYNILMNPDLFFDLVGKDTIYLVNYFKNLSKKTYSFEILLTNYNFLKKLEIWIQVLFDTNSKVIPLDDFKRNLIARSMNFINAKDFEAELIKVRNSNRISFENEFVS